MSAYPFRWEGKASGVNEWKDTRVIPSRNSRMGYRAMMYESAKYKAFKAELARYMRGPRLKGYFDLSLKVSLWKVRDSDGVVKPVMDALEDAGVVEDDNRIRNFRVIRAYHKRGEKDIIELDLYRVRPQDVTFSGKKDLFSENTNR